MTEIDVVLLDLETLTAHCSDGVERPVHEMYDSLAERTDDPDEAFAVVIKVGDDSYIVCKVEDGLPFVRH